MKRGYLFTFIFMIIVAFVFAAALAVTNHLAQPAIAANEQVALEKALIYAFDVPVDQSDDAAVRAAFSEQIERIETPDLTYYTYADGDSTRGYAVPFTGAGLWGAIRGFLSVTPALDTVQGLVFLEQNETPGLGGRIDEQWFRDQFRGQSLLQPVAYGDGIDAITGATSSSTAVLRIVNEVAAEELEELEAILNG